MTKWTLLASFAAFTAGASVTACSLITTSDLACDADGCSDRAAPSSGDEAGAPFDAGSDAKAMDAGEGSGDACTGASCFPACAGGIRYVSTKGSDTYAGCTEAMPLATIGEAIRREAALTAAAADAHADASVPEEIHVCAGSYDENLAPITRNVILRGGYDCTTWTRTGGYGYPTFDAVNETRLGASAASAGNGATLTFNTANVDPTTVVDGFTVLLSTDLVPPAVFGFGSAGDAYGILSVNFANPTITDVHVSAGTTVASRSIGIAGEHGSVRVTHDLVEAGSGQHSIGVYLYDDVGGALIQDNTIHGGGATGTASEGIEVTSSVPLTGDDAIRGNVVEGGSGKTGSLGITIDNSTVSVVANQISGGAPTCAPNCYSYGVLVRTTTNAFLADSNFVAGTTGTGFGFGIWIQNSSSPVLTNNVVFGGPVGGSAAIVLDNGANGVVRHNTLTSMGQTILVASFANTTLENNLGVAVAPQSNFLTTDDCTSGATTTFASIANNAAVGYAGTLLLDSAACPTPIAPGIAGFDAHFGSVASGNVRIDGSCSDETAGTMAQCSATTACAISTSACGASVIAATDSVGDAMAAAVDATKGYPLVAGAPCALTSGGADRTSSVPVDILGVARTVPVSIGAYEDDQSCP